jgi:Zn-dependent protease
VADGAHQPESLRHVDLVGTLLVPGLILLLSAGGLLFGWAKPVPVNFSNLRRPKQDMLWVAAAGPGANLVMALGWALLLKLVVGSPEHAYAEALKEMARVGIGINGVLMVLNLLPLPPLDGGRIVVSLLPCRQPRGSLPSSNAGVSRYCWPCCSLACWTPSCAPSCASSIP